MVWGAQSSGSRFQSGAVWLLLTVPGRGKGGPCTLISEKRSLFPIITAYPFLAPTAINPDTTEHILSNTFPLKSLQAIIFNPFPPLSVHSSEPYDAFRHQILGIILKKKNLSSSHKSPRGPGSLYRRQASWKDSREVRDLRLTEERSPSQGTSFFF